MKGRVKLLRVNLLPILNDKILLLSIIISIVVGENIISYFLH